MFGDGRNSLNTIAIRVCGRVIVVTGESRPLLNELDYACVLRKAVGPEELIASVRGCIQKAQNRS